MFTSTFDKLLFIKEVTNNTRTGNYYRKVKPLFQQRSFFENQALNISMQCSCYFFCSVHGNPLLKPEDYSEFAVSPKVENEAFPSLLELTGREITRQNIPNTKILPPVIQGTDLDVNFGRNLHEFC